MADRRPHLPSTMPPFIPFAVTPSPVPIDAFRNDLISRCPQMSSDQAEALGRVWRVLLSRIIDRMTEIAQAEIGLVAHIDDRPEMAFEIARITLYLQGRILDEKARRKPLEDYCAQQETAEFEGADEARLIENTARAFATGVWVPLMRKLRARNPLLETPDRRKPGKKLIKPVKPNFRKHMHFVPQLTTRPWADTKSGRFDIFSIGLRGNVEVTRGTAASWGASPFLYTQQLEHLLGLIEGDVKKPYRKLVDVEPLSGMDVRHWIAFLASQLIRTPSFIDKLLPAQKDWIERTGTAYPTDPAHLGRAYETLFNNNDFYAACYDLITSRRWSMLRAAAGTSFLKGDNPIVATGDARTDDWQLVYPMTPLRCFVAGPEREPGNDRIVPHQVQLDVVGTSAVNGLVCRSASQSVIGISMRQETDPRPIVQANLTRHTVTNAPGRALWGYLPGPGNG